MATYQWQILFSCCILVSRNFAIILSKTGERIDESHLTKCAENSPFKHATHTMIERFKRIQGTGRLQRIIAEYIECIKRSNRDIDSDSRVARKRVTPFDATAVTVTQTHTQTSTQTQAVVT